MEDQKLRKTQINKSQDGDMIGKQSMQKKDRQTEEEVRVRGGE